MGIQWSRLPVDEANMEHDWIETNWVYLGTEMEPLNGSCGSVILDEDGDAVSFFHTLATKYPGCGLGVSAATLGKYPCHVLSVIHRCVYIIKFPKVLYSSPVKVVATIICCLFSSMA